MAVCEPYKSGCLLRIKLTPNASFCGFKDTVIGTEEEEYLKTYIHVAPEKGKANAELIKLLAKTLKIAKSNISIISGTTDHYKKIYIEASMPQDELCLLINDLVESGK